RSVDNGQRSESDVWSEAVKAAEMDAK
ncbi:MAG: hypothetical protein JWR55_1027, partial [Aeromicrobium sp.]|nr:hypothetical protein [Aeromicrobium sp.]